MRQRLRRVAGVAVVAVHADNGLGWLEQRCLAVMEKVYSAAEADERPLLVELWLYPSRAALEETLRRLAAEAGAAVEAAYELVYEAWSGVPRIHVSAESASTWFFEPMLGHEAVHSVLHPGLEYYLVAPPPGPQGLLAAHIAATAVKDLEVHGWAWRRRLGWLLEGQRRYWSQVLEGLSCRGAMELGDALRGSTPWLAAGMEPPLSTGCREKVEEALDAMRGMLASWLGGGPRPWSRVEEFAELVAGLLEPQA